jgi:uncharacterized LabA/DUF88 family protein
MNLAVFIDFDNIEIGVKTTLGEHFDINTILEALKERGEVVTKIAYADWTRAGEYSRALTQHAIRLVQRNLTPGGDKNGADINLALDALEMAFTHPHINAYVIVGGDSDFLSLVEKLKQYNKKVFVVGGRAFTSIILQRNCHEFIAYENLVRRPSPSSSSSPGAPRPGRPVALSAVSPISQAFPIVRRALKILADREVTPQTGLLKSTLLQLDSTFSERSYGASSFLDFAEKLSQAGLVLLKHSGRSVMVELNPASPEEGGGTNGAAKTTAVAIAEGIDDAAVGDGGAAATAEGAEVPTDWAGRPIDPARPVRNEASRPQADQAGQALGPVPPQLGDQAEGVKVVAKLLGAATRWPMYVRNVKQILRAGSFDERAYGFGGLMDLLRACQRESLLRLERDRRGGLRVFQGQALARTAPTATTPSAPAIFDIADELGETDDSMQPASLMANVPAAVHRSHDTEDLDGADAPPITVVDTTAELLGRATGKRSRTRAAVSVSEPPSGNRAPRGTRKAAARKPAAAPRRARKKPAD